MMSLSIWWNWTAFIRLWMILHKFKTWSTNWTIVTNTECKLSVLPNSYQTFLKINFYILNNYSYNIYFFNNSLWFFFNLETNASIIILVYNISTQYQQRCRMPLHLCDKFKSLPCKLYLPSRECSLDSRALA